MTCPLGLSQLDTSPKMLASFVITVLSLPLLLSSAFVIEKRATAQCCPRDLTNSSGVLINTFAFFTCAYPAGACDWAEVRALLLACIHAGDTDMFHTPQSGQLENTAQQNCPNNVSCENSACTCPIDNTGATGRLITMQSQGIQCAYPDGACSFSEVCLST